MKPHEEWLFKAEQDLLSAEYLLSSPHTLFDIAIYHAQQCSEKSLKAWLSFNEKTNEKTHNLVYLTQLSMELDHEFEKLLNDSMLLNPYATLFRYPQGDLMPSEQEVKQAIIAAKNTFNFVKQKIISNK